MNLDTFTDAELMISLHFCPSYIAIASMGTQKMYIIYDFVDETLDETSIQGIPEWMFHLLADIQSHNSNLTTICGYTWSSKVMVAALNKHACIVYL